MKPFGHRFQTPAVCFIVLIWASGFSTALSDQTLLRAAPTASTIALEKADPSNEDIFQVRFSEEPLVPLGGEPSIVENRALAGALREYSRRISPDDFSALEQFLEQHPGSAWNAALLAGLGMEYYNTAYYSRALSAWTRSWALAKDATYRSGKVIADRAAGELAYMYARLGRMNELETLLKSVEGRVFMGPATEKIDGAREGLWNMKNRPEISFRCGPLALHRIKMATDPQTSATMTIFESASSQKGLSLTQVAELSRKIGLNYQMAFREKGGDFIVPSVLHWKVDHYAAIIRRDGDRYLLQDPTFRNDVWATRQALEAETSGYFAVPPGPLPKGWRKVESAEGEKVWGKGFTSNSDGRPFCPNDPKTGGAPCKGMAVSSVHLMLVNLNLSDEPVGYSPPVGPEVKFVVRYNHRDSFQPATFTYGNFGSKWTHDWLSYLGDNPQSPSADVNCYMRGGGVRTFTGFNTNTLTFAHEQYDQTLLKRVAPANYEMTFRNGSKLVFSRSDGSVGSSRRVFLTQVIDPSSNAVTLNYDGNLRITGITDAIGQTTMLTYGKTNDIFKITRVTDPFGRFASFDYDNLGRLTNITDVIGLTSRFTYETNSDFINALITPYGTNTFIRGSAGTTRWLETIYADGSKDRVEFNQSTNLGVAFSDAAASVPQGMRTDNRFLWFRNTYYWSRTACATAYGDYTKAKVFHWLHMNDVTTCAGILESTREALEGRVWYDYDGQNSVILVGDTRLPKHIGRVLDDGTTQLYTHGYNGFGNVTNTVDPLGRTFSYFYASNGIDLLEARMTRAGKNELLFGATYNAQHLPLTTVDAAGQTNRFTYNARGQLLTETNPKNETTSYTYDTNGYLTAIDGPLPATNDTVTTTYDSFARPRTRTDESGYTLTVDYDAMDRVTRITYPDSTFEQMTYDRLDVSVFRDRAGRQTFLDYDNLRQLTRRTDPLNRVTHFEWCSCGDLSSLTDPLGRTTSWRKDVQGRLIAKEYGDGSKVTYAYENATSRLRQVTDEKGQHTQFAYNRDDTIRSIGYANTSVPTAPVTYIYDADYQRIASMTDGTGTTDYGYVPIIEPPVPGAGNVLSVDGPLADDTLTFSYDELGRRVSTAINGVATRKTFDADGRVIGVTNALGSFTLAYDGASSRLISQMFPNNQITERNYGDNLHDRSLQRITSTVGANSISEFLYVRDQPAARITSWSQQAAAQSPSLYSFNYDAANQILLATVTNAGALVDTFTYTYDFAGNRLLEQVGTATNLASYNALNQISIITAPGASATNEWDADDRLVAVNRENERIEFAYDGLDRLTTLRKLVNGSEVSYRRFVWCDNELCEERDGSGVVTRRFFEQGMKVEAGATAGKYFYTRDHLGSVRELTDESGNVRARYAYDPWGRRTRVTGDLDADFGFAGMFWASEAGLAITRYRSYDPHLGRWLSRDPLDNAEVEEGPNLYAYVGNNPINLVDPLGLCCEKEREDLINAMQEERDPRTIRACNDAKRIADLECQLAQQSHRPKTARKICLQKMAEASAICDAPKRRTQAAMKVYQECMDRNKCWRPPQRCPMD